MEAATERIRGGGSARENDERVERLLIGQCLIHPDRFVEVDLEADAFSGSRAELFRHLRDQAASGQLISVAALPGRIRDLAFASMDEWGECPLGLAELQHILGDCQARRRLRVFGETCTALAADASLSAADRGERLRELLAGAPAAAGTPTRARFQLRTADDLMNLAPAASLAGSVLNVGELIVVYGAPGTGKSFLTLGLACAVDGGGTWLGLETAKGPVIYVAAEGAAGLGRRLAAWLCTQGTVPGVRFITEPVNLLQSGDVAALLSALRGLPDPPILLIVDTLARCMLGGDENSARDMGIAIGALDAIRAALGCAMIVVHHTGKSAETERGSSALRAAADTMFSLKRDGELLTVVIDKQKNAVDGGELRGRLVRIELPDGTSSCMVDADSSSTPTTLGESARKALRALAELFDENGATFSEWLRNATVPETTVRRLLREVFIPAGYVTPPSPPKSRGGKYQITAAGKAALSANTATVNGGDFTPQDQGFSPNRHSPPTHRHGGDRSSQPPLSPPYRGDGVAVGGGEKGGRA